MGDAVKKQLSIQVGTVMRTSVRKESFYLDYLIPRCLWYSLAVWGVFHVEPAGVHVGRDVLAGEHRTRRKIREDDQEAAMDGDVAETG